MNTLYALKLDVCLCKCLACTNNKTILFYHRLHWKLLSEDTVRLNVYAFSINAFDKNSGLHSSANNF